MTKLGILGCGWLGERIAESFRGKFSINTTTTSHEKFGKLKDKGFNPSIVNFSDDPDTPVLSLWKEAENMDVIIITVPFSNRNSPLASLSAKVRNLSSFLGDFKGQMLFMSSTSVYPDIPKEFNEDDLQTKDVVSERLIKSAYPQINILRLAGLMGDDRLLKNYKVSHPELPINHIHYADVCAVIEKIIDVRSASQVYNVVAPIHPTKKEVINIQRCEHYRSELMTRGRIISSRKLVSELDYSFKYPDPRLFHLPT